MSDMTLGLIYTLVIGFIGLGIFLGAYIISEAAFISYEAEQVFITLKYVGAATAIVCFTIAVTLPILKLIVNALRLLGAI